MLNEWKMRQTPAVLLLGLMALVTLGSAAESQETAGGAALLQEGEKFYRSGQYQEAIETFESVIEKSVDGSVLLQAEIMLSYTYFTIEKPIESQRILETAILRKPDLELERERFVPEFIRFFDKIKAEMVGVLTIESIPSRAAVWIDGRRAGKTPLKSELLFHKYFVRVVHWGYSPMMVEFKHENDKPNVLKVDLTQGHNWIKFLRASAVMAGAIMLLRML